MKSKFPISNIETRAIIFSGPAKVESASFKLPACGPEEIIAETIYSFVSPGTELRVLSGTKESKNKFPLIPGYSWVGRVIEVGSALKGWAAGDLVTGRNPLPIPGVRQLWGGQASHHRCAVSGYDAVLKLPEGAVPWNYIAVEVAAISWRGAGICFPAGGETAVVIGQGLIGAFNALWLLQAGCRVIVLDMLNERLVRALKWGVSATVNPGETDAVAELKRLIPDGADIVFESSGSMAGVELAGKVIRQPSARAANTGYSTAQLHANPHYWPRLVYQASYTFTKEVTPGQLTGPEGCLVCKPGDRTVDDRLAVIEKVRQGQMPLADIVTEAVPVSKAPWAYEQLRDHSDQHNTMVFDWKIS